MSAGSGSGLRKPSSLGFEADPNPTAPAPTHPSFSRNDHVESTQRAAAAPSAANLRLFPAHHRSTLQTGALRHSMVSDRTVKTEDSRDQTRRKKSGLRGALSKLLGRKKKGISQGSALDQTVSSLHGNNAHDSMRSGRGPQGHLAIGDKPTSMTDSEGRPSSEFIIPARDGPSRVGATDILSAGTEGRKPLGMSQSLPRRQADDIEAAMAASGKVYEFRGLSPRPVSTHERSSLFDDDGEGPGHEGRAGVSDEARLKRRSRSLSGLLGLARDRKDTRRRSDEIRYWRESYDPTYRSRVSSDPPDDDDLLDVDRGATEWDEPPKSPIRPFDFGDLSSMNKMAGMKITHAASMDGRIGELEKRVRRLERRVARVVDAQERDTLGSRAGHAGDKSGDSEAPWKAHGGDRSVLTASRPSTQHSQVSRTSRTGDRALPRSSRQRSKTQQEAVSAARPVSTATIRGATSLPTLPKEPAGAFTIDHYTTLMALIDTERSARLAMEAQLKRMGHQLNIVTRSSRSHAQGTSFSETSVFEHDEEDDGDGGQNANNEDEVNERRKWDLFKQRHIAAVAAATEAAAAAAASTIATGADDSGIATTEPAVQSDHGSSSWSQAASREGKRSTSVFREEFDNDDDDGYSNEPAHSPRTMSLSQMTFKALTPKRSTGLSPPPPPPPPVPRG